MTSTLTLMVGLLLVLWVFRYAVAAVAVGALARLELREMDQ